MNKSGFISINRIAENSRLRVVKFDARRSDGHGAEHDKRRLPRTKIRVETAPAIGHARRLRGDVSELFKHTPPSLTDQVFD